MTELTYVTGNKFKIFSAKQKLEPLGIAVNAKDINCPEIQADSIEEVAIYSSTYACEELKQAVLKMDSGLIIPALNNFPGPYTKYVEQTITEDGILKLMEGKTNRDAYFLEVLSFKEPGKEVKLFYTKTEGKIALEKEGEYGWGYDHIFIPNGKDKPLACFDDAERASLWESSGYEQLAEYLKTL